MSIFIKKIYIEELLRKRFPAKNQVNVQAGFSLCEAQSGIIFMDMVYISKKKKTEEI